MEMLTPAPGVVVGAAVVKRFPGYGVHRGTIDEIDGNSVIVHWAATDERTTLTLTEAAKRVVAIPSEGVDDDDQSVTSAALGIQSSSTSFSEHGGALHVAAPRHVLLELDDEEDLRSIDGGTAVAYGSGGETGNYEGDGDALTTTSSRFWGVSWDRKNKKWRAQYRDVDGKVRFLGYFEDEEEAARTRDQVIRDAGLEGQRRMNAVDATSALVPKPQKTAAVPPDPARAPTETSSRFWGVTWDRRRKKWKARYTDADGKDHHVNYFDDEEEAARAVNKAIRDAGLEGRRRMNPVDATGALVPRKWDDRSAVVAPAPARAPSATTSKFWGVNWDKQKRRWKACYNDATGKRRHIGLFDTQEAAAHAVNAAIRRADLEGRRHTNPVVDGQLVPRARQAPGHGPDYPRNKRRREEPATATPRARRPRRAAIDYAAMEDPDFEGGY